MGRKCLTCDLPPPVRKKVDRLLAEGNQSIASLAREFPVGEHSLTHHRRNCLHTNLRTAVAQREANYYDELRGVVTECVTGMRHNVDVLQGVIEKTRQKKHYNTLTKAMKEMRGHLELAYKMLAHITEARGAEDDIVLALHRVFEGGAVAQIIGDLTTPELEAFHKVLTKVVALTGEPLVIEQIDVAPVGACTTCAECAAVEESYKVRMIRTKAPANSVEEIDHDSRGDAPTTAHTEPETGGEEPDEPVKPRQPRPPLHTIHFESAQAFAAHRRRRR